ncbi:MAG TPA: glycoside hydrolase family 3 protein, partial [Bacillota bacterium]|nr:glycoside hydrolase family 3 protein [Bacillota bacterium]
MKKFVGLLLLVITIFSMTVYGDDTPLYLNAKASPEQRTEDLLARMTLPEKVGQLMQVDLGGLWNGRDVGGLNKVILDYGVGAILSGGGGAPVNNRPEGWAATINDIQNIALKTRLKIPIFYGVDAVHGHNNVIGATIYPFNLGLAATFNPEFAKTYAAMTSEEIAATGIHWTFAPVLDVATDPRWGRTYETFGEDPYLVSVMGSSQIQGFQASGKILACAKHFIVYSGPNNGMDRNPADLSERKLREIYLPPFRAAVKAGVGTFMINSGEVNGVPAHASRWLLQDLLRKELGFKGLIDSDYLDIEKVYNYHNAAASLEEAVGRCFNAGIDMTMLQDPHNLQQADMLIKLAEQGVVPVSRIDDAVRKVLYIKFKLGLFEHRTVDPAAAQKIVGSEASRKLARTIADQSIV